MTDSTTYVGMDVHKADHHVAILFPGRDEPQRWVIRNEPQAIRRMVRKVQRQAPAGVLFAYEAGVCGFALARRIESHGAECHVIAPSLIPRKPGQRVRTDRRDAAAIAQYLRGGMLTRVHPPTPAQEAARDLCRLRLSAQRDLQRSRHQLGKFLLRYGYIYADGKAWTQAHLRWLRQLTFEEPLQEEVFREYLAEMERRRDRLAELEQRVERLAQEPAYREQVGWLCCLRGVATVAAMTVLTEIHDFVRFDDPRQLMSYLGLTPSEDSSGEAVRKGSITKAGNERVRWVAIQSAWCQQKPPRLSKELRRRRAGQPDEVVRIAEKAQKRLYKRYWQLVNKGKPPSRAIVAVARELVGFIWAILKAGAAARQATLA